MHFTSFRARHRTPSVIIVSLIDVFTILIFFLLSSAGVETLIPSPKAVHLPASTADKSPKENLVIVVSAEDIAKLRR